MVITYYDIYPTVAPDEHITPKCAWLMGDIETLRDEYGVTPNEILAAWLGRTVRAMQEQARRCGISAVENRRMVAEAKPKDGWQKKVAA